jgi:hypothetical protein
VQPGDLHLSTFVPHLHTGFRVSGEAQQLELVEATDTARAPNREQFSLVFHGPSGALLEQRLYQLEHDAIGTFELFLVPVGQDATGYLYESVFNRRLG